MPKKAQQRIYKVVFSYQGQVIELYARSVSQGSLFGFVEVEDLVFGARSNVVVDPSEEGLRSEFGDAKRLYLPLHAVLRIDEVEHEGTSRVRPARDGDAIVRAFPVPVFLPKGPGKS